MTKRNKIALQYTERRSARVLSEYGFICNNAPGESFYDCEECPSGTNSTFSDSYHLKLGICRNVLQVIGFN